MKNIALGSVTVGILSLVKQLMPSLPLMGEEYYGYPQQALTGEEQAMLGIPFHGEDMNEDLGDELGDEIGNEYVSSDDIN
jgi:hypothetical protein